MKNIIERLSAIHRMSCRGLVGINGFCTHPRQQYYGYHSFEIETITLPVIILCTNIIRWFKNIMMILRRWIKYDFYDVVVQMLPGHQPLNMTFVVNIAKTVKKTQIFLRAIMWFELGPACYLHYSRTYREPPYALLQWRHCEILMEFWL